MSETNGNEQEPNTGDSSNPFAPENAHILSFIMQARIYDALITILREQNEESALQLLEVHFKGQLMTPPPWWNGEFLTDE